MNSNTEELQVLKNTSALGSLIIKLVPKAEAKDLIVKNHYSHKWNEGGFGKYNFGIFRAEEPDKCLGVAVYGYMKNPRAKIFTHPNPRAWMCELNRMWIDDTLGHNAESVLIAASIKLLRKIDSDGDSIVRRWSIRVRNDLQSRKLPIFRISLHEVPAEPQDGRDYA